MPSHFFVSFELISFDLENYRVNDHLRKLHHIR